MAGFLDRPTLYSDSLPNEERSEAVFVDRNLMGLDTQAAELASAVELYVWGKAQSDIVATPDDRNMLKTWSQIGARAGALCIYAFFQNLQGVSGALSKCPSLFALCDRNKLGRARKSFDTAFPLAAKARLSAAHPGQFSSTSNKLKAHAVADGLSQSGFQIPSGSTVYIEGCIIDDSFTSTIENRVVSYKVTKESADTLSSISQIMWGAVKPSFDFTKEKFFAHRGGTSR